MDERFLVTGSGGCIGAWTVAQLVGEGTGVVAFDASDDDHRLRLLLSDGELAALDRVQGDITDLEALERVLDERAITHVIHLAALQVPFCRADPPLGARVNVVGTVNVFEAVARRRERIAAPVVYASSVAAYDALDEGEDRAALEGVPSTLYGVYKRANEGTANVYAEERDTGSVGLRPHTVYGPGRDQGLTSAPTLAMEAAARGNGFHIPFGGRTQLHYAPDVARAFVGAARDAGEGAVTANLGGEPATMEEVVRAIEAAAPEVTGRIAFDDVRLPFPEELRTTRTVELTPLADGVRATVEHFRQNVS
jgi:UDP-glucuronate 4-epimerase